MPRNRKGAPYITDLAPVPRVAGVWVGLVALMLIVSPLPRVMPTLPTIPVRAK